MICNIVDLYCDLYYLMHNKAETAGFLLEKVELFTKLD